MKVTCPMCNTRYDVSDSIPSASRSTVCCAVCQTQLEIEPRSIWYLYIPKVTVRTVQPDKAGTIDGPLGKSQ
jgi:predicted Zn finger-like uncharacterized protein